MQTRVSRSLVPLLFFAATAHPKPVHLRCEYLQSPLGIDTRQPNLSWQSDNTERNWRQTAYQIFVASSPEALASGKADIWNSGKQLSDVSVGIPYAGPPLLSRRLYYWAVRVWDQHNRVSQSEEPVSWEMGLLQPEDWSAKWITRNNPESEADLADIRWIWVPGQNALATLPQTVADFRLQFDLPDKPKHAVLYIVARGNFNAKVNGRESGSKKSWNEFDREDIADELLPGTNSIEITVTVPAPQVLSPQRPVAKTVPAALAALLELTHADGTSERIPSNTRWEARLQNGPEWKPAEVVGSLDDKRFGDNPAPLPQPASLLRREFSVSKSVQSARLYVTALGSYRMFLNGVRVGHDVLTPDFTDYRKRVLYQTYDVTSLLVSGHNVIGAMLGDGWFASALTWIGRHYAFLPPPTRLLAQLELTYSDGTRQAISTDPSWKTAPSPILRSEIYAGEVYDARLEQPGWSQPAFDDSHWAPARVSDARAIALSAQMSTPVQVTKTLKPESIVALANDVYVFDMGQNMVGWATLRVKGPAGTRVRMRFAEILNPDRSIYRENLRNADATDTYTLRGGEEETFTPHFTFHGFRYVEVTGYPGQPTLDSLSGEVLTSVPGDPVGQLTTSSPLVNKMWSIGIWGQRGNFLSVPTDCPQRDERLGWMADAAVFWRTGAYNFDTAAFSEKWMRDVVDAQTPAGAFTNVAPDVLPDISEGAPGWGDAGVIVPWTTWVQYGDTAIVMRNWDAMQRWMTFIQNANPDFIRKKKVGPDFADWLAPDRTTPKDLVDTAYWALIADMMSQMAHAIGKENDAAQYSATFNNIKQAFQRQYIKENGDIASGSQSSYVLALYVKLAPKELEPVMAGKLVNAIEARDWHVSTGFLGTPFLLFTLAEHGRADVAYRLLLNETYPSWGYMLSKGATTWWERWNGDTGDPSMNSFNHYAFGSVLAWVYRSVGGIDTVPGSGFHELVIHPRLDPRVTSARAEYASTYGLIKTDWNATPNGPFALRVTVPANTRATVFLPRIANAHVRESGKRIHSRVENDNFVVAVGSGSYNFEVK
ncbi:MAG TPA: family 78 glycoside hydrolase catalytic domain [Bryobacteraceae bacterium]|jgi:alpha-L-rhamnosidase|nr:family 78 glycoside hydrolase catalytic domain [Bryobacteraceae bacterium]